MNNLTSLFDVMNSYKYFVVLVVIYITAVSLLTIFLTGHADAIKSGFVDSIPHKVLNGVYIAICKELCFDEIKNQATKGYDKKFLAMPEVKSTCLEAKKYGITLNYCDKTLGTI